MGSTKTKFRQRFNVYKSYFRSYSRKHNEGSLDKGKPIPQASFFGHFFENGRGGKFTVGIIIIDGAEDVYSLRRKELSWQYRLETFSPKGHSFIHSFIFIYLGTVAPSVHENCFSGGRGTNVTSLRFDSSLKGGKRWCLFNIKFKSIPKLRSTKRYSPLPIVRFS